MGGLSFLRDLAEMTGGLSFVVRDGTDIAKATASIGRALRNQYTIGYVPSGNGRSGQWRRIRVKVEGPGMTAYAARDIVSIDSPTTVHNEGEAVYRKVVRFQLRVLRGCLAGVAAVALVTLCAFRLNLNLSTAGSFYFLIVMIVAVDWGFWEASVTWLIAVNCLNYFFVPPVLTWRISDPQNWIALATFEITALTVSRLSTRAQDKARAEARQRAEVEKLYELSRRILYLDRRLTIGPQIVSLIQEIFRTESVALFDAALARLDATGTGANDLEELARSAYFQDSALEGADAHTRATRCGWVETGRRDRDPRPGTGPAGDCTHRLAGRHCAGARAFLRKREPGGSGKPDRTTANSRPRRAGPCVQNAADGDSDGQLGTA